MKMTESNQGKIVGTRIGPSGSGVNDPLAGGGALAPTPPAATPKSGTGSATKATPAIDDLERTPQAQSGAQALLGSPARSPGAPNASSAPIPPPPGTVGAPTRVSAARLEALRQSLNELERDLVSLAAVHPARARGPLSAEVIASLAQRTAAEWNHDHAETLRLVALANDQTPQQLVTQLLDSAARIPGRSDEAVAPLPPEEHDALIKQLATELARTIDSASSPAREIAASHFIEPVFSAPGIDAVDIVGDGRVVFEMALRPGTYLSGLKRLKIAPGTMVRVETVVKDGKIDRKQTRLAFLQDNADELGAAGSATRPLDTLLWTNTRGIYLDNAGDDRNAVKLDISGFPDLDLTRTLFGVDALPSSLPELVRVLRQPRTSPADPKMTADLERSTDTQSMRFVVEVNTVRAGARLPLGERGSLEFDAKSRLTLRGDADETRLSGVLAAKKLAFGDGATRLDAHEVSGTMVARFGTLSTDGKPRFEMLSWSLGIEKAALDNVEFARPNGEVTKLGPGVVTDAVAQFNPADSRDRRAESDFNFVGHFDGDIVQLRDELALANATSKLSSKLSVDKSHFDGQVSIVGGELSLDGSLAGQTRLSGVKATLGPLALDDSTLTLRGSGHVNVGSQGFTLSGEWQTETGFAPGGRADLTVAGGSSIGITGDAKLTLALERVSVVDGNVSLSARNASLRLPEMKTSSTDGLRTLAESPSVRLAKLDPLQASLAIDLGPLRLENSQELALLGATKIDVHAGIADVQGHLDADALSASSPPAKQAPAIRLAKNSKTNLKSPVHIDPAPVRPMRPTVSPVAILGLLTDCKSIRMRVPLRTGAKLGSGMTAFTIPPNASLELNLVVRNGQIVATQSSASFVPPLKGPAWFGLEKLVLRPVPGATRPGAAGESLRLQLWPVISGDGDLFEGKGAEVIATMLGQALGGEGSLPGTTADLAAMVSKLADAPKGAAGGLDAAALIDTSNIRVDVDGAFLRGEQNRKLDARDTLRSIAKASGVPAQYLISANPALDRALARDANLRLVHGQALQKIGEGETLSSVAEREGVTVAQLLALNPQVFERSLLKLAPSGFMLVPSILPLGVGNTVDIASAKGVQIRGTLPNVEIEGDFTVRSITFQQPGESSFEGGFGNVHLKFGRVIDGFAFALQGNVENRRLALLRANNDGLELGPGLVEGLEVRVETTAAKDATGAVVPGSPKSFALRVAHFNGEITQGYLNLLAGGRASSVVLGKNRFDGSVSFTQGELVASDTTKLAALNRQLVTFLKKRGLTLATWDMTPNRSFAALNSHDRDALLTSIAALTSHLATSLRGKRVTPEMTREVESKLVDMGDVLLAAHIDLAGEFANVDLKLNSLRYDSSSLAWDLKEAHIKGEPGTRPLNTAETQRLIAERKELREILVASGVAEREWPAATRELFKADVHALAANPHGRAELEHRLRALISLNGQATRLRDCLYALSRTLMPPCASLRYGDDSGLTIKDADLHLSGTFNDGKIDVPGVYLDVGASSSINARLNGLVMSTEGGELGYRLDTSGVEIEAFLDKGRIDIPGGGKVDLGAGSAKVVFEDFDVPAGASLPDGVGSLIVTGTLRPDIDPALLQKLTGVVLTQYDKVSGQVTLKIGRVRLGHDGTFALEGVGLDIQGTLGRLDLKLPAAGATPPVASARAVSP